MNISNNLKILIAEDNGVFRKLLSAMVERLTGEEPQSVSDGEEALEMTRQENFDLIFMDNHMPKISGIEATQKIRESVSPQQQPYIVAVTGTSDHYDLRRFGEAGVDFLLHKPFHLTELAESIENAIQAKARLQESCC